MEKNTPFTLKGTAIWFICAIFFLYEFLLRTVIGTFQHPIMYDLELTTFQFSILSSTVYLLIYGLMQIPVGLIVDRIGLKKSLLIGGGICAISSIGFALSYGYTTAIFFRFLTGLGSSFGFICLLVSVYEWLPTRHIALLIGVSQFIGTMGPMIAAGPLETMSEAGGIDWRTIFILLGIVGFVIIGLIAAFVENNHSKTGQYTILKHPEPIIDTLKRLFSKPQAWYIALFSSLVYFSIEYLSENEGKIFITAKGFSAMYASYMISLSWLGYAIGCPLMGWLSDFFSRRKPYMILAAVFCSLSISMIVYSTSEYLVSTGFFFLGIGASGQSIAFATIAEQFRKKDLAAALSLNNGLIVLFASFNAPFLGIIIDFVRTGQDIQLSDYTIAFSVLVAIVCLSLIFPLFFIRETYCKSKADFTILRPFLAKKNRSAMAPSEETA